MLHQGEQMLGDSERHELRRRIKEAVSRKDALAAVNLGHQLLEGLNRPADVMLCASSFNKIAGALSDELGIRKLRTYVVRSVTVEPILPYVAVEAVLSNYLLEIQVGGYGSYVEEMLNPGSDLAKFKPDLVLVVLDLEEIAGRLPELCAVGIDARVESEIQQCVERIGQLLGGLRSSSSARLLLQGLVLPDRSSLGDVGDANLPYSLTNALQSLNQRLAALCGTIADCVFFDVDRVAARYGRASWRDARLFFSSRLPVSTDRFHSYSCGLVRSLSVLFRAPRKILCTDLDNTLWGGVLGEDGPEGIATGTAFPGNCYFDYQKYLKHLSARGVLLAIVSKNNVEDVREAFQVRSADLAVSLDDFVATKIGWTEKSTAIRDLAQEVSLGLDSFVFVDDSPAECEAIRQQLPEVAVVCAPALEPWRLTEVLTNGPFFDVAVITGDDINRPNEYRAQVQRTGLANSVSDRNEFLASLEIVCTFQSALQAPLSRAAQLLAKTNQFNLTTRRHSTAEIEKFASTPGGQAVVIRVRDRFGDAGVVGLALARNKEDACYIDSLLLSCRVIGRGIETALLAYVGGQALQNGARRLIGEFIATKKNAPCASFYLDHGFTKQARPETTDPQSTFYELDLTVSAPQNPNWITLEGN